MKPRFVAVACVTGCEAPDAKLPPWWKRGEDTSAADIRVSTSAEASPVEHGALVKHAAFWMRPDAPYRVEGFRRVRRAG